jgi:hypothetical protein
MTTKPTPALTPGLHIFDPQGHAILVGLPGQFDPPRQVALLCSGGEVTICGATVRDPDVVDQFADRLHLIAQRMRDHRDRNQPEGAAQ